MIIAVDEAVAFPREAFGRIGEVRPVSGTSVSNAELRDADALIVRSVTRVDEHLLAQSRVKFVGTATIGMDHLDLNYLEAAGIRVANAAGSNANAVAEYVVAVLLVMAGRKGWDLARKSLGVIGVGHIGSRVARKAAALGMNVLLCDPPLRASTGDRRYGFLEDVIGADVLTLHVPLTRAGLYPTWHMIGCEQLRRLTPAQLIINTSRGAVVSGSDLKQALRNRQLAGAVLDVWEGEPAIDCGLLDLVDLGTFHIAGYSLDGKVCATAMIYDQLCRFFGIEEKWDPSRYFPQPRRLRNLSGTQGTEALRSVVLQAYDIHEDDRTMRSIRNVPEDKRTEFYERLRSGYAFRLEFRHFIVDSAGDSSMATVLSAFGFMSDVDKRG